MELQQFPQTGLLDRRKDNCIESPSGLAGAMSYRLQNLSNQEPPEAQEPGTTPYFVASTTLPLTPQNTHRTHRESSLGRITSQDEDWGAHVRASINSNGK